MVMETIAFIFPSFSIFLTLTPKAVTLYKSKVVEALIKELQAKLDDELPDDEQKDIMQRLAAYNQVKKTIANKIGRPIL